MTELKKDRLRRYSSKHPLKGVVSIENRHLPMAIFDIAELKLVILVFSRSCHFLSLPTPFFLFLTTKVNVGYFLSSDTSKTVLPNRFNDHLRAAELSWMLEMCAQGLCHQRTISFSQGCLGSHRHTLLLTQNVT